MNDISEVTTVQARQRFSDLVNRVAVDKEWIRLTRRGKAVAGAVPLEEFGYFEGPEGFSSLQGIQTFEDISVWHEQAKAGKIGEASATYQVKNAVHRVTSAEARDNLSDVLNRVCYGKERIIVTRRDWDLFAIIPPEVFDKYLEADELEQEYDRKMLEEAERNGELDDTIPWEEFKKELELE